MTESLNVVPLRPIEQGRDKQARVEPGRGGHEGHGEPQRLRREEPLVRNGMGAVLRRIRHQQRRTLDDVATDARVSMPYLSEIERGRKEASSEVLASLCRALDITPSGLLIMTGRELAGPTRPVTRLVPQAPLASPRLIPQAPLASSRLIPQAPLAPPAGPLLMAA